MLIYNTTYLVADKKYGQWIKWLREKHIPFMLECGFTQPQVAKVLTDDVEQEGTSISVQFHIRDMYQLGLWDETHAERLLDTMTQEFGADVLSFSTVLEIL